MTFLAFILFHAFLYLNVKPSLRQGKVQRLLGKSDGRRNLPGLYPLPLTMIRPFAFSNCSAFQIPVGLPASVRTVVCPIP